ncbi:MBL fold metallo-hydrolase [Novosphingobium pentaromativorans]|nr:MBL fold metallo-hydrolase [Novosphingobium pentaromativorans]
MTLSSNGWCSTFVTLGTQGGPLSRPDRSQPANALVLDDGSIILVDTGDGAAQQMAKAGLPLDKVRAVFLSHMHFDHTAGAMGILSLHYQSNFPEVITVYGPPGTVDFVNGLLEAMKPFAAAGFGVPGEKVADPRDTIKVVEITDGSVVTIGDAKVTAAQNTHYTFAPGSEQDRKYKSLALRFDLPDRSIVYTGDTGPSTNVERLAKGADLLVSEVIDVPKIVAMMKQLRPDIDPQTMQHLIEHQETQHMPYEEVGKLAKAAGVKAVALTHIVPGTVTPDDEIAYRKLISQYYDGPVVFSEDLDKY